MRALLDVNVLITILDADHVLHARARAWLRAHAAHGWASRPVTQNGCEPLGRFQKPERRANRSRWNAASPKVSSATRARL